MFFYKSAYIVHTHISFYKLFVIDLVINYECTGVLNDRKTHIQAK